MSEASPSLMRQNGNLLSSDVEREFLAAAISAGTARLGELLSDDPGTKKRPKAAELKSV